MSFVLLLALRLPLAPLAAPPPPDRWFGTDKVKHFLLAGYAQSMTYSALRVAQVRHGEAQASGLAITISLSALKERRDRRANGQFSVRDLVWSVAGAAASAAVLSRTVR